MPLDSGPRNAGQFCSGLLLRAKTGLVSSFAAGMADSDDAMNERRVTPAIRVFDFCFIYSPQTSRGRARNDITRSGLLASGCVKTVVGCVRGACVSSPSSSRSLRIFASLRETQRTFL